MLQDCRVSSRAPRPTGPALTYARLLLATASAYVVAHHLGLLSSDLGLPASAPRGTTWADWLDLFVPFVVLVPAAATLRAARAGEPLWWLFGAGAVLYTCGHGIHLAGNSLHNAGAGEPAHLWDEVVGHTVWYVGAALVVAALAATMRGRPQARGPAAYGAALAVGLTWATNAIGGGTVLASLAAAAAALVFGWRHRRELAALIALSGTAAALVLVGALIAAR